MLSVGTNLLKGYLMGGRYIVIGPDGRQTVVNAGSEREAKMKVILSQAHIQPLNRKERRSFIAQAKGYKAIKI